MAVLHLEAGSFDLAIYSVHQAYSIVLIKKWSMPYRIQVRGYSSLVEHRSEKRCIEGVITVSLYPRPSFPKPIQNYAEKDPLNQWILPWGKEKKAKWGSDIPSLSGCYRENHFFHASARTLRNHLTIAKNKYHCTSLNGWSEYPSKRPHLLAQPEPLARLTGEGLSLPKLVCKDWAR